MKLLHLVQHMHSAERYVQTIKKLLKKSKESGRDEALALLEFRNTTITGMSYSPAQLLMSRRLRGCLPVTASSLQPTIPCDVKKKLESCQTKQKFYYDQHARPLPPLTSNAIVRYQAIIVQKSSTARSYNLLTANNKTIRRNRRHLKVSSEPKPTIKSSIDDDVVTTVSPSSTVPQETIPIVTEHRTRSGRLVRPPPRYANN